MRLLLLCFVTSLVVGQGEANCVRLSQCQHLDWMMRNKHNIAGVTPSEVTAHITALNCGFEGNEAKVTCNNVEETAGGRQNNLAIAARGGLADNLISRRVSAGVCRGSLRLYHLPSRRGSSLGGVRVMRFQGRSFRNVRRFVRGTVVGLANDDTNCCWSAHSRLAFRGDSQLVPKAADASPTFQPKSLKKLGRC